MRHDFHLTVFGLPLAVQCDSAGLASALHPYLEPWVVDPDSSAPVRFSLSRESAAGAFRVERNGALVEAGLSDAGLIPALQRAIDGEIVRRVPSLTAVHAGVAVHRDAAILLVGPSGSGKTTLVRELLACGAEYSSDEYALLDREGIVHPWPRPLMIRDAEWRQRPVLPAALGARVRRAPARPGIALFLSRQEGAALELKSLSQGGAVLRLLQNTPHVIEDRPGILEPIAAVARAAAAYEGTRGAAREAAVQILALVERRC